MTNTSNSHVRLLLLTLWTVGRSVVHGQAPPPPLSTNTFSTTVNFRQNACELHQAYIEGKVSLRDGLKGVQLNPVFGDWGSEFFTRDNEGTGEISGMLVEMMDILSNRAGFTWRDSYGTYGLVTEGKDWTDLAVWATETYDVVIDYYYRVPKRLEKGISFLPGWYDGSLIMVGEETIETKVNIWAWVQPFDWQTWVMMGLVCLFSGVIYWCMCRLSREKERFVNFNNPTDHFFLPALALTGHFEFKPRTVRTMILTISLAVWSIFLISAYTANLASFFIVEKIPTLGVKTIHDAVFQQLSICVYKGTPDDNYLTGLYPTYPFLRLELEKDMFLAATGPDKRCRITVTTVSSFNTYEGQREFNPNCALSVIGRVIKFRQAAFIMKSDSGQLCTNFIRDVLTLYIEEMDIDGVTEELWTDYLKSARNQDCSRTVLSGTGGGGSETNAIDEMKVTLTEVGGAFIVQMLLATIAVAVSIIANVRKHRLNKQHLKKHGTPRAIKSETPHSRLATAVSSGLDNARQSKCSSQLQENDDVVPPSGDGASKGTAVDVSFSGSEKNVMAVDDRHASGPTRSENKNSAVAVAQAQTTKPDRETKALPNTGSSVEKEENDEELSNLGSWGEKKENDELDNK